MIFKTRYNDFKRPITNSENFSRTDKTQYQETDIYCLIQKYGIKSLMNKNKPEHELYIDTTIVPKTLQEAINIRNEFENYFAQAPARFRKLFHDNPHEFYLAYRQGEYDKLLSSGALTQEQINLQKNAIKKELQPLNDKIAEYEKLLKEETDKNERLNALLNSQQNTPSVQPNQTSI